MFLGNFYEMGFKSKAKAVFEFIWEEDSLASWLVNVLLAFVLIKFLLYPGLGLALGTDAPIVAVVSGSMEHDQSFEEYWDSKLCCNSACSSTKVPGDFYESKNISKEQFKSFSFVNGFNKGDIMILYDPSESKVGDVIVYMTSKRPDPIIHRIIDIKEEGEKTYYWTKGDNNCNIGSFENRISEDNVIGKAVWRVPWLGWVKIVAVNFLQAIMG